MIEKREYIVLPNCSSSGIINTCTIIRSIMYVHVRLCIQCTVRTCTCRYIIYVRNVHVHVCMYNCNVHVHCICMIYVHVFSLGLYSV